MLSRLTEDNRIITYDADGSQIFHLFFLHSVKSMMVDFATFQQDEIVGEALQLSIGAAFDLEVALDTFVALQNKALELRFFVVRHLSASCPIAILV